jgi:hypothetical protein
MILTNEQIRELSKICVEGKGGKDSLIASAMFHKRKSAKYYDAISDAGVLFEYKKQKTVQFFDPIKLATMTEEQRKINILFFMHNGKNITSIYHATYDDVIKKMGYTSEELDNLTELMKSPSYSSRIHQLKAQIKKQEIQSFALVHSFEGGEQ